MTQNSGGVAAKPEVMGDGRGSGPVEPPTGSKHRLPKPLKRGLYGLLLIVANVPLLVYLLNSWGTAFEERSILWWDAVIWTLGAVALYAYRGAPKREPDDWLIDHALDLMSGATFWWVLTHAQEWFAGAHIVTGWFA